MTERPKASRWRKTGIVALLFVGWLLVTLGVVGVYLQRSLYNSDAFASRVSAVISEPDVQNAVATQLTTAIVERVPKAAIARPLIQSAAMTIVTEPAFKNILTQALVRFQKVLVDPNTASLVFKVEGAPQMIQEALSGIDPQLAAAVSEAAATELAKIPNPGPAFRLIQLGAQVGPIAWGVILLGLILGGVASFVSPNRRRGLITSLVVLAAAGLGLVLILALARIGLVTATASQPVLSEALGGAFQGLFGELRRVAYWIGAIGLVASVIVWSLRFTLPVASSAAARARESASGALDVASDKVGGALSSASDSATGALTAGSAAATATTGAAVEAAGHRSVEAQDLMVVIRSGFHRLLVPAATNQGRLIQGSIALVIGLLILFAWSIVIDVIVFALGLGLLALALNRILLVIFSHRAQRALAAEQQTAVGAGSSTDV
jgi:hypothetical protein